MPIDSRSIFLLKLATFFCIIPLRERRKTLEKYPNASVETLDMVKESVNCQYDAALDCMGLHMLITDADRENYLRNAFNSLHYDGAPMLLFRESYRREGAYLGTVSSIDEWTLITGDDYQTPQPRYAKRSDGSVAEVNIPLVPARAKDKNGYISEMKSAGFAVEEVIEMDMSSAIPFSVTIFARKGKR